MAQKIWVKIYHGRPRRMREFWAIFFGTLPKPRGELEFECELADIPRIGEKILFVVSDMRTKMWSDSVEVRVEDVGYVAGFGRVYAEGSLAPLKISARVGSYDFKRLTELHSNLRVVPLHAA